MFDWIVCLGAERSITDGQVTCPGLPITDRPRAVPVTDCLTCRHLMAAWVDRVAAEMCSVEAPDELQGA